MLRGAQRLAEVTLQSTTQLLAQQRLTCTCHGLASGTRNDLVARVNARGVTIPEVLVAIVILTVGLLGLAASAQHVSGLVAQGSRTGAATTFGVRRLELLRAAACGATPPADGIEELTRGSAVLAVNVWTASVLTDGHIGLRVVTRYVLSPRRMRTDSLETVVVCR